MGVKRKLDEIEQFGDVKGSQRQSILDISMCKLRTSPVKRVEPPLLKSVLILNTLKHIETELIKEGMPTTTPAFVLPEADPTSEVLDFLPAQTEPPKMETESPPSGLVQCGPLPSIDTFVGSKCPSVENHSPIINTVEKFQSHISIADSISTSLYPVRVEEMFGDLDISLCDFDIFSSIATGMKLTPLSAEEVQHSFPNCNSSLNDSYASLRSSAVSPYCKGDAALEDLDNIMQILVGS